MDLVVTPGVTYDDFILRWSSLFDHLYGFVPKIELIHHQMAHLATAFYGSGYDEATCLSLDATGDGLCSMSAIASRKNGIRVIEEIPTQNSIGFFYTMMTKYCGFGDGDEYKLMGLAPYGTPNIDLNKIIKRRRDGWLFDWQFIQDKRRQTLSCTSRSQCSCSPFLRTLVPDLLIAH